MDSSSQKSKLSFIHNHYILIKLHYFLFFSGFGVAFPILSLTLRAHGLSNTFISISNTIVPFLVFFSSPFFGFIADKSRRFLLTFNILLFAAMISLTIFFSLPPIQSDLIEANLQQGLNKYEYALDFCANQDVVTKCSSTSENPCVYYANCKTNYSSVNMTFTTDQLNKQSRIKDDQTSKCGSNYQISINSSSLPVGLNLSQSSSLKCQITCSVPSLCQRSSFQKKILHIACYAILFIISLNLLSAGFAIGASIGFAALPRPDLFGKQRLWGTVGFGLFAFVTSRIHSQFNSDYVYVIMFIMTSMLTIIVTSFIQIREDKADTHDKKKKLDISTLKILFQKVDVIIFLSTAFFWGTCFGCLHPYLTLYIDEIDHKSSRSIIGFMFLIASVSEVTAFYLAKRVITFFGANISSIIIFLAFAIRFGGYYLLPSPYFYLPLETMHFFNFGILYVLIAEHAERIAPSGLSTTLQGTAHGVMHGLGTGVGLLISSYIYVSIQQRTLFLVFAVANIVAAILYSILFFCMHKRPSKENVPTANVKDVMIEKDARLHDEILTSVPMMAKNNNEDKL